MANTSFELTIFPSHLIIETTAFCTQQCIHCAHKTLKRPKGNMQLTLYKKIIDEIAIESPQSETWMTFYGEALILRSTLCDMIKYAKNKGIQNVVLNSNAMLLDKKMAEELIESRLDRFIISMDAFSKDTYEKIRVGGKYEQVLNFVLPINHLLKVLGIGGKNGKPRL